MSLGLGLSSGGRGEDDPLGWRNGEACGKCQTIENPECCKL